MKHLILKLSTVLCLLFTVVVPSQTMTFDSSATEPGFSISGFLWDTSGVLFPAAPNVNSVMTIQKNQFCFDATSFKVACFAGGGCAFPSNGTWRVWSNRGDETTFVIGSNPNQIVSLGWSDVQWVKIQLQDPGTAGTNQTFDFDDFVYSVPVKTPAAIPTISASANPSCPNADVVLNISGNLNDATSWYVYNTNCGTGFLSSTTGSTITVSPNVTTTYYIKGVDEKGCVIDGDCGSITINMKTPSTSLANVVTSANNICPNETVTLTASGGVNGDGASIVWYSGPNGTGSNIGVGTSISVTPSTTTTYYVRREGDCNTTSDRSITINADDTQGPSLVCNDINLYLDDSGNATLRANASADFSGTQGTGNWSYGKFPIANPNAYSDLPNFTGFVWNNPGVGAILDFPQLDPNGGHPQFEGLNAAVRRWTSNMDGTIYVSGDFYDRDTNCGDGANVRIYKNGTQVYEYLNIPGSSVPYSISLSVSNGDVIDFAIDPKFDAACDDTHFTANIDVATATDNCGLDAITFSATSFDCDDVGSNTISIVASDIHGNTSNCMPTITVVDSVFPVIECIADINADAANALGVQVNWTEPVVTDDCPNPSISVSSSPTTGLNNGSVFPIGTTTVTYTVTDGSGNAVDCSFDVIVQGLAPEIECPENITVNTDANTCGAFVNFEATDPVGIPASTITYSIEPGSVFGLGTVTVSATATNSVGSSSCEFDVTVIDNESPIISGCPTGFDVFVDANGNVESIDLSDFTNAGVTYSDNCDIDTFEVSENSFSCSDISALGSGVTLWINEFHYDNSGTDTGEFVEVAGVAGTNLSDYNIVLYNGSGGVVYNTINLSGVIDDEGNGYGAVDFQLPTNGLQNGPDGIALVDSASTVLEFISYEGSFTATDGPANGLTSVDLGVDENSGTISGESLQLTGSGSTGSDFTWSGPSTDSPGSLNSGQTIVISGPQVTLTVTDVNGNVSTCTVPVTVIDNESPIISGCPTEFEVLVDANGNVASIDLADFTEEGVTYSDNCGIDTVEVSENAFDCSDIASPESVAIVWINEFHYDNSGTDTGEFVEVAGVAGTDLSGYSIVLYNGSGGVVYNTINLSGSIDDEGNGYGAISAFISGIQNGAPDGIALVDNANTVLEFISYEGSFTATDGPANGLTSVEVGSESSGTEIGESLQLIGSGSTGTDFTWSGPSEDSPGSLNSEQTIAISGPQVTLTVTDVNGNVSTCTVPVTVIDNEAPIISFCPTGFDVFLDESGNADAIDFNDFLNAGISYYDNCGIDTVEVSENSFSCSDIGSSESGVSIWINEFHYDNASTDIGEFVEVAGVAGTDLSAYSIVLYNGNGGSVYNTVNLSGSIDDEGNGYGAVSVFISGIQNGSPDGIALVDNANTVLEFISYEGDFTATNGPANGLTSVNVGSESSNTPSGESLQLTGSGSTGSDFTWSGPSTDSPGSLNSGQTISTSGPQVTLTLTDNNGNVSTCTVPVTVIDNLAPAVVCPSDIVVSNDAGECGALVPFEIDVNDNCDGATVASSIASGSFFDVGTTEVTVTGTDASGNESICTFTVTVEDNEAPQIVCAPGGVRSTDLGTCEYVVSNGEFDASFTDNCTSPNALLTNNINNSNSLDGVAFPQGITEVTWTVDDGNGQLASCITTIEVQDNEAPTIDCAEYQLFLDGNDGSGTIDIADVLGFATDNCDSDLDISLSQTNFDCGDIGGDLNDLIISEYVDGSVDEFGLDILKCIEIFNGTGATVSLNDYELYVYADGSSTPTSTFALGGTIDDRGVFTICYPNNNQQANGQVPILYNGNDAIALVNNGAQVDLLGIIGNDPGATGWSNGSVSTAGTTLVRNVDVLEGATTNNTIAFLDEWTQYALDDVSNLGTHDIEIEGFANNVVITVTDDNGNVSTCEASVTVIDNTNPIAIAQDVEVVLDASGNGSTSAVLVNNGSYDNCAIGPLQLSQTTFTCADIATNPNPVTLTVFDVNGNSSTANAFVTVIDDTDPTVQTQDITVQLGAGGNVLITADQIDDGSSDACGIASISVSPNNFSCGAVGENTVTLTVTDNNNNVSSATAIVTVEDVTPPTAVCEDITITLNEDGVAYITTSDIGSNSFDNCGIGSSSVSPAIFSCEDQGDNTVTLTVTDVHGNQSTCTAIVTVEGDFPEVEITQDELPEFCQGAAVVLTANSDLATSYLWSTGETTQSIEVEGDGTYSVTVTSATACTAFAEYTVGGFDAGSLISAYTILATDRVFLQGNNLVESGGVGVTTPGTGNIKLHQASTVVDFGQAATFNLNQGSTIGTQIFAPANPTLPNFVFNTESTAASPDAIVGNNQTQTLTASVYDVVDIGNNATVTFTQSNVYINELITGNDVTIEFDGCANVFINEAFNLSQNGVINANGNKVVFYVDGDVQINKGSNVRASIYANTTHKILAKGQNGNGNNDPEPTYMKGLFIADVVQGTKNVIWSSDDLCDPCPIEAPSSSNPPVVFGGDDFRVMAYPNPTATEFSVKVITENMQDDIQLDVFDMSNKQVHSNTFTYDELYKFGNELESGVYIVKIRQANSVKVIRLIKR
ncbi:HYR domain-containing protein [Psychroserpens sp. BH13MA-6]